MRFKMMMLAYLAGWASATVMLPAAAAAQRSAPQPAPAPASSTTSAPAPASQAPAAATPAPARVEADPAVWVVRDADTTIYLFGTFHLLDGHRDWFNDEVRTAFDASQELVLEVLIPENPAELQPLIARFAVDPQRRQTSTLMPAADWQAVRTAMSPQMADAFDQARIEPWFFSLTLGNMAAARLGLSPENGPETVLRNAARGRNMPVGQLETIELQLGIFDGMSQESQLSGLREAVTEFNNLGEMLRPMITAWSTGNVDGLSEILNEATRRDPAAYAALFTNRNANWARWVRDRLARPGTVFVAVGAGHLGGPGSVQEQLRTLGIQSARVPHTVGPR